MSTSVPAAHPLTGATILRALVPAPAAEAPAGFTLLETDLSQGLPARLPLTPALTLVLVLPVGLARPWLRADADRVVTSSEVPGADRQVAQLVLHADGRFGGAVGLTTGLSRMLPTDPSLPARLLVRVLSWHITAACVVGPGAHGAWLRLAWATVGGGADAAQLAPRRPDDAFDPNTAIGYPPIAASGAQGDLRWV